MDPLENAEQYVVVLKVGGNELDDPDFLFGLVQAVQAVQKEGHYPVIVHGGGKAVTTCRRAWGWPRCASRACVSPTTLAWRSSRWC